jgi:hypothetical protein
MHCSIHPLCAIWPAHFILFHVIIIIMLHEENLNYDISAANVAWNDVFISKNHGWRRQDKSKVLFWYWWKVIKHHELGKIQWYWILEAAEYRFRMSPLCPAESQEWAVRNVAIAVCIISRMTPYISYFFPIHSMTKSDPSIADQNKKLFEHVIFIM